MGKDMHKLGASFIVAVVVFWSCFQFGCNSPQTPSAGSAGVTTKTVASAPTPAKAPEPKPYSADKKLTVKPADQPDFPDLTPEIGGRDGAEGFNRSMGTFNFFCFRYVLRPVGYFWGSLFPRQAIISFSHFCDNIAFTRPLMSCALQAKFGESGLVFSRFMINTTLGVAGFFDPADKWFGIEPSNEDFGQAFASWGCGPGPFLTLPFIGNTDIRDGIGLIFDYALDIKTYVYGGNAFSMLNKNANQYRELDTATRAYSDPYQLAKEYFFFERYIYNHDYDRRGAALKAFPPENPGQLPPKIAPPDPALKEVEIPGILRRSGYIDTMLVGKVMPLRDSESMWCDMSLWNTDFFYRGSLRSVPVFPNREEMEYKVWLQDKKDAPLAVIVPGTGSHCTNDTACTLGEIYYDQGYTVVAMSNTMNWQFVESASSSWVPGFTPDDARDTSRAIAAAIEDLEKNKDRTFPKRILTGVSLGAMQTLFIAAMEKTQPNLKFDRYLAINPPVDMLTAVRKVDGCISASKNWPENQFFARLAVGAYKYMNIAPKQEKPFTGANTAVHEQAMGKPAPGTAPVAPNAVVHSQVLPGGAAAPATAPAAPGKMAAASGPFVADDRVVKPAHSADYLPFSQTEAQVLIGLSFKMTIQEIIASIHQHHNMGILKTPYTWGTRTQLYQEINDYNFEKYCRTFMVKYYSDKDKHPVTVEQLNDRASILRIMPALVNNDKIRILQTGNDFLENEADRHWLVKQFGSRCVLFRDGGHLGELYYAKVRDYVAEQSSPFAVPTAKK